MKLGKAFSDSITIGKKKEHRLISEPKDIWWLGAGRVLIFTVLLFVTFFILIVQLFNLTLVKGHVYRNLAEANRTKELIRHAPRGILYDRTGKPLSENISLYRLILPCTAEKKAETGTCTQYVSREEGEQMATEGLGSGEFLEVDYQRRYPDGESTAHVVGYTGEITDSELKNEYYTLRSYHHGDRIGRSGAEALFEEKLRGRDGKELVEVDASGKILRVLGRNQEVAGNDVTLSLDWKISQRVRQAFPPGVKGAVIVSRPDTGEILALYSSPSFDPNIFTGNLSEDQYEQLVRDPDKPLFNRAIGGVYPPGSTFKIVTAIAGLEEGIISAHTVIEDTGVITIGQFSFANWYWTQYGKTEGSLDIVRAIARSNDIFFYKVGEQTGIDKLAVWARKIGIGMLSGIELDGEATGLMPDPAWKKKQFTSPEDKVARNDEWYSGDTYHVAIGQGYLLTTPLQVNMWTDLIAYGGKLCRPTIEKVVGGRGHKAVCRDLKLAIGTIDLITQGMVDACSTGGTGWPMFDFHVSYIEPQDIQADFRESSPSSSIVKYNRIPVACKTGTSEFGNPQNKTHAWFTVFAPVPEKYITSAVTGPGNFVKVTNGEPEISVTVLLEGAGEGSNVAAPVAKEILNEWFSR